jgi:YidC/Oxa1 family membrane protein insertase
LVVTLLTKSAGILEPIASLLGLIMNGIFEFFNLFGIQNIALSIIIFTFIVRALMLPLTIKQQKFSKLSARMNPELQKIQAKYKGKKDQESIRKMQAEQQALYAKYGANPTSGCLPLLITLPLMFALYQVIINIPAYVGQIKGMYEAMAVGIKGVDGYDQIIKTVVGTNARISTKDLSAVDNIINVLAKLGTTAQGKLAETIPALSTSINGAYANINHANNFFGMNITNNPNWKSVEIIIPILAAVLSFVQSKQVQMKPQDNKDNPMASAMNSMIYMMPLMQFFFCITFPLGIGLYWIATSVFMIIQQYFVNRMLDRLNVDELIEKSAAKAAKKRKSPLRMSMEAASKGMTVQELAKTQTKFIENTVLEKPEVADKTNSSEVSKKEETEEVLSEDKSDKKLSTGPKSVSEIANLLKNKKL